MKKAYSIVHKNLAFTSIVIAFASLLHGCTTPPRPEVIYFEAQPKHPKAGDSVELKWHTENAVEVEISEIGKVPAIGSGTVKPTRTTWYTLSARNSNGAYTVQYLKIPIQGEGHGQSIIDFKSENQQEREVKSGKNGKNQIISKKKFGNKSRKDTKTTVIKTEGPSRSNDPVLSPEPPMIIYFKSNKQKVVEGETVELEWSTQNAKKVEIKEIGPVLPNGKRTVKPRRDTSYILVATNAIGKEVKSTVQVEAVQLINVMQKQEALKIPEALEFIPKKIDRLPEKKLEKNSKIESTVKNSPISKFPIKIAHARGLTVPTQIYPENNIKFKQFLSKTSLKWMPVEGAAYYKIEVEGCDPSGCEKGTKPIKHFKKLTKTEFNLDIPNSEYKYWRWRVWAVDRKGNSGPKSKWWEFRYTKK